MSYEESYEFKTSNKQSNTSNSNDLHLSLDGNTNNSNPMISVHDVDTIDVPDTAFDEKRRRRRLMAGAATVGGVAGFFLVGPIVAIAAAGGAAALVASKRNGPVANSARATGGVVANVGSSMKQFDDKHQIASKTTSSISNGCNWVSNQFNKGKK